MYQNIIRLHDESFNVTRLQQAINKYFTAIAVPVDGRFTPLLERAVREFQRRNGLDADGIVGPQTLRALNLDLTPTVLTEDDYVNAAQYLGVTVAHVKAVAEVETQAEPFWSWAGMRTPILYERHIFDREIIRPWQAGQTESSLRALRDRVRASDPDLCNPSGGGYGKQSAQYAKLERACKISETVALRSASWGTFQIMGFHSGAMGWYSVQAFVRAMQASQLDHLRAFARLIKVNRSWWDALKASDWLAFARGYNGPAQKGYDERMAAAFRKYSS